MHVEKFDYNSFDDLVSNTYVVSQDDNKCVVIDPGKDDDGLINYLNKNSLVPCGILLTHGHYDHLGGVNRIAQKYKIPVYIHKYDECMLYDSKLNLSIELGAKFVLNTDVITLRDGEKLNLLNEAAIIVVEADHPFSVEESCFNKIKKYKYGDIYVSILWR